MHKLNRTLDSDVKDALQYDPYLDARRIVVKADHGNVTLTGAVPTYSDLLEAADDTWRVSGVITVDNELLVGLEGEALDDAAVVSAAQNALDRDRFVPKGSVTPVVVNGWVTLTGQVKHHFERRSAERTVGKVAGVLGVTNDIVLSGDPMPTDVADRINAAFRRNAIIDDSMIEVTTSGRTVYLDGTVGSGYAMMEAVDTSWAAPGVSEVVNRLVVVP